MEEQEILEVLKTHVERSQKSFGLNECGEPPCFDRSRMDSLTAEVWNASNAVGQLNPRNRGLLNEAIQALKKVLQRSLNWYTRSFQAFNSNVARAIEEHGHAIIAIQDQLEALQASGTTQEAVRAMEQTTQELQYPYVQLFCGRSPVLDIGCGRGEFLEMLKQSGIEAYGVDSDRVACAVSRRKLLKVVHGDLFEHLRQLPERSLGGIFAARVMEYLPSHQQLELVALCSTRLRPGGVIVIETINPDSDFPFGRNCRVDPSHLRPIYPEILKSMLDSNGFRDSRICVLAPRVTSLSDFAEMDVLSGNGSSHADVFAPTAAISGSPAYTAIAWRE